MMWFIYIVGLFVIAGGVGWCWKRFDQDMDFLFLISICALFWPILFATALVMLPFAAMAGLVYWMKHKRDKNVIT